jgi:aldose 1-epimerase
MPVSKQLFGTMPDGRKVDCYALSNANGMTARIMTYGGTLLSLHVPDRHGIAADVVLGFDTLSPYLAEHPYFGTLIGRYANRIASGRFHLNGKAYQLACNNGINHLHGGTSGFGRHLWQAESGVSGSAAWLKLSLCSRDNDEGYPGTLHVRVTYTLAADNTLRLDYEATTDAPTIINLTNHAYFNLAGQGNILDHELLLAAEHFLPVNGTLIPTGEQAMVKGTPMDFTKAKRIGADLQQPDQQLTYASGGYDHNWVLTKEYGSSTLAAEVNETRSGRRMQIYTTQPGIQFYSGNFLDGSVRGKHGVTYEKYAGLCLETQHVPDSPNQPQFPSTVLLPREVYAQTTIYRFDVAS